jgi:hypothetical protein
VGNMLYGMQGMSSDVSEVRSVRVCFLHCWAAARPLKAQEVGNAVRYAGHEVMFGGAVQCWVCFLLLGSCKELDALRRWAMLYEA